MSWNGEARKVSVTGPGRQRECQSDHRAATRGTRHGDRASPGLHHAAADRESESAPAGARGEVWLEDSGQHLLGYPLPVVEHLDRRHIRCLTTADADGDAGGACETRVLED